ncbi:uncharacterized protein ARMOST_18862 [Armillaria ostoyae]|uniref:Uncharacterized protein n=1 Tax=Armillaria ostoyae TaxID=47428 RepID=A0A284S301_ARMOS|nr:uncharacterized protein ARMOST_18862 [Armillaria ostoyae]
MSSQPSTATPSFAATLGALYIGATIAAILFGITNLQTVIYYKKYPHDWWLFRYSVALLWVLDALHVALSTHALYFYLVGMFGDLAGALVHSVWSFKMQLDVNVLIVIYVQGLYAIRLWKLGRHFHKIFPWFVFLAVAASLGASIFMIYDICMTKNFSSISAIKVGDVHLLDGSSSSPNFGKSKPEPEPCMSPTPGQGLARLQGLRQSLQATDRMLTEIL